MFTTRIHSTPFHNDMADAVYSNIFSRCETDTFDESYTSTLRYFLHDRIERDEKVEYICDKPDVNYWRVEDYTANICNYHNSIRLVELRRSNESGFDPLVSELRATDGFEEVENVEAYYKRNVEARAFINRELKTAIVVTKTLNVKLYHLMQFCIPVIIPWYFETMPNEEEMEFLKSFLDETDDRYIEFLRKKAEDAGIREKYQEDALTGYERHFTGRRKSAAERNIHAIKSDIESYEDHIRSKYVELRSAETTLFGLMYMEQNEEENKVLQFFRDNKDFHLKRANENDLSFYIDSYIGIWDESAMENVIANKRHTIYNRFADRGINAEDTERFLKAVFVDQDIRIRTWGLFSFDINNCYVEAPSHDEVYRDSHMDRMPNFHLYEYRCIGDYRRDIVAELKNYNLPNAMEICRRSVMNFNIGDGTVFAYFMENFPNPQWKCYEAPDGTLMTCKEVIEWCKQQEGVSDGETD